MKEGSSTFFIELLEGLNIVNVSCVKTLIITYFSSLSGRRCFLLLDMHERKEKFLLWSWFFSTREVNQKKLNEQLQDYKELFKRFNVTRVKIQNQIQGSDSKEPSCNAGDLGLIPGLERFPGEGNGKPLQYSCLENSIDRGNWTAIVHGVAKSWT